VIDLVEHDDSRGREELLRRRARQADMSADIAVALNGSGELRSLLARCCEAVVAQLDVAFARVWTVSADGTTLELQSSAGLYTHIDGPHARVPIGSFKIGLIAAEKLPHLTNDVPHDPRVGNPEWAKRERMVAFAGYPLLMDQRLVGVLAMFARHPLPDDTLDALAAAAQHIALGIERHRAEAAAQLERRAAAHGVRRCARRHRRHARPRARVRERQPHLRRAGRRPPARRLAPFARPSPS
jgi:GAF domain-containing protein